MAEFLNNGLDQARIFWASETRKKMMSFRSPLEILGENPTVLLLEAAFFVWATLTLKHALRYRGRFFQLWCAAFLHGLVVELLSYTLPDIDNFWHYEGTVMLFNRRLPLYIMFLYPCFYYTAYVAVSRLRLGLFLEPFAMAIAVLILDVPYDILGVKLLWWTWHDTDPNLFERTYYVPWTSYMFHLTFTSTFLLVLNVSRAMLACSDGGSGVDGERVPSGGCFAGFVGVVLAGCLTMPLAVLGQLLPLSNFPHDVYGIHTEVLFWILLGTYVLLVWIGDRNCTPETRLSSGESASRRHRNTEIVLALAMYYLFILAVLVVAHPENYSSTGLHQTIGNCSVITHTTTGLGHKLPKRPFLCASNYDEPFSLLCANSPHPAVSGMSFYTICGTAFPNLAEYKCIILAACLMGVVFNYQLLFKSGLKPQKQKKN